MAKGRGGFPGMGGGMGGGVNMQQLMKQAQQMQADMARAQEEAGNREVTATAGGGMVTVTVNGRRELKKVTINPACVDPEDVEMLEDLVFSAVNEALTEAAKLMESEMGKFTGGANLGF